jgi:hypothetical protein
MIDDSDIGGMKDQIFGRYSTSLIRKAPVIFVNQQLPVLFQNKL